ncbi:hypothetical protein F751_1244 [Auxenochlorella protothecoides]|uniref:Uncharacterized protein n=1 Tax=Auxenochlorella protothecoides TaxID=3075 RepID=A0A087SE09_AUXPR|nr:hypothetical protein F751_1244 [Auxenochlorella protothecoides]KFM23963.1 hypothetical protein F751_1244 [Auxenochlorella protothecoides]RMZ56292.1 hypothetical protein APUTEX25_000531 [Auxenochlorella protothecoides]|eukprot:RMZ56292.1 hypothetical protein APUTEX25_000531 [Auxenochlorella protothecoides]
MFTCRSGTSFESMGSHFEHAGEEARPGMSDEDFALLMQQQELVRGFGGVPVGEPGGYTSATESAENEGDYHDEEYTYEELSALGEVAGTISKGLSAEALAALPRMSWAEAADSRSGALDTM